VAAILLAPCVSHRDLKTDQFWWQRNSAALILSTITIFFS
jgi:hypothetical protein